jgi:ATP-dependent Clp protease, protease subunit
VGQTSDQRAADATSADVAAECGEACVPRGADVVERIVADADRDLWFTAQEALEYGMVDHVLDGPLPL